MHHIPSYKALKEEHSKTKTEFDETLKHLETLPGFTTLPFPHFCDTQKKHEVLPNRDISPQDKIKRPKLDSFSKLEEASYESDASPKKAVPSAVVVKYVRSPKSRKEVIRKQNVNSKIESRNRRILGMLQGTLRKFQDEAQERKRQDLKRVQVEQKVEAAFEEEVEEVKRQKEKLLNDWKGKQLQLRYIEEVMSRVEPYEVWENNQKKLCNFIVTKAEPAICFMPSTHTSNTRKLQEKCKANTLKSIERRKMQLIEELNKIKEFYTVSESSKLESADILNVEEKKLSEPELSAGAKGHASDDEDMGSEQSFSFHLDEDDKLCLT